MSNFSVFCNGATLFLYLIAVIEQLGFAKLYVGPITNIEFKAWCFWLAVEPLQLGGNTD